MLNKEETRNKTQKQNTKVVTKTIKKRSSNNAFEFWVSSLGKEKHNKNCRERKCSMNCEALHEKHNDRKIFPFPFPFSLFFFLFLFFLLFSVFFHLLFSFVRTSIQISFVAEKKKKKKYFGKNKG